MITSLRRRDAGFTLAETLVAMLLLLAVVGAIVSVAHPQAAASLTQPAAIDTLQRGRAAAEVLRRDLAGAGAGLDAGIHRGPLPQYFAAVIPRRFGPNADAFDVARADAITVVSVSDTASQTFLAADLAAGAPQASIGVTLSCPIASLACGIAQGDDVLVFDREGQFDFLAVLGVSAGLADVRPHAPAAVAAFRQDAPIAVATSRTYYLDAASRQLRYSDGDQTDVPVADSVVSLQFEYFGDPFPPSAPQPPLGTANCLFDAAGVPWGGLAVLTPSGGSLAPLPLALFTDGPWCGAGHRRYDADLLRIRRVRVTVRAETPGSTLRASGSGNANAGISRSALLTVPDIQMRFDVAPRNLEAVR
jgi:hypothetical protein